MKSILTIVFCCTVSIAFAQPTNNIKEDTSRANRYFEDALSNSDKAAQVPLLLQALQLYEHYPFDKKQIEINSRLAYAYFDIEDSLVLKYANKAIELANVQEIDELHPYLLYSYISRLQYYYVLDSEVTIQNGEKALEIVEKPSETYFDIMHFLTIAYAYNYELKVLENSISEMEDFIQKDTIWNSWRPLLYRAKMQLSINENNFEKAIIYGKECITENKKYGVYGDYESGPIYVEVGNAYAELGQYEKAINWMEDGIEIANPNPLDLASYYANIAMVYNYLPEKRLKAIDYMKSAFDIFSQDAINNRGYLQIISYNLSVFHFDMKDYNNALLYVKKSMTYGEIPQIKIHYANILQDLKRHDEALVIYQELLIHYSENFQYNNIYINPPTYQVYNDNYWASIILISKATSLITKGEDENNIKDIQIGIETALLAQSTFKRLLEQMNGFDQARLTSNAQLNQLSEILLKGRYLDYQFSNNELSLDNLFKTIEERKSLLLLETLTPSMLPDSVVAKEEILVNQMRQYEQKANTITKDSVDFYQTAFFNATVDLEKHLIETSELFPKEVNNFYNINYPSSTTIQNGLANDELIINYVIVRNTKNLYIYLTSNTKKQVIKIDLEDSFFSNIDLINQLLQNPFLIQQGNREKFIQLSHELHQVLIEPIVKELGDKKKLIIIPEGELFYLPFEVLLASNEIKPFHELDFLIRDFDISYQYSATIYQQLKNKPTIKNNSFLGFAPVFKNGQTIDMANRSAEFIVDSLYRSVEDNKFIGLPNSKIEVETIAKNITAKGGNAKTLMEEAATKNALIQSLKNQSYQFVHIATHGIVNFQNAKLSALVCYDNTNNVENSLFFANEIQMQDIQADLVVLSSCESGIGQLVTGEGLIALNRSFIYSGANNVLFSLWKVNDEHTSNLMIYFYQFYFQNPSYSSALRQTKLKMLKDPTTANPRFWAAFVLIGE